VSHDPRSSEEAKDSKSPLKRHRLWIVGVLLLSLLGVITLFMGPCTAPHSIVEAPSPNGRYTARASDISPWFSVELRYDFRVEDLNGEVVRKVKLHDQPPSWTSNPIITWSPDSKAVTMDIQHSEYTNSITTVRLAVPN